MGDHCPNCHDADEYVAPDRDEALGYAFDTLERARDEAMQGRVAEAQTLGNLAGIALSLAQLATNPVEATLTGGPH